MLSPRIPGVDTERLKCMGCIPEVVPGGNCSRLGKVKREGKTGKGGCQARLYLRPESLRG